MAAPVLQPARPLTARKLLLDLLRASEPDAWPVRVLVEVAALFDITENALRVNITRLVQRGLLVQDSRGYYRLAPATRPVGQWINAWTLGEQRVVDWQGGWLTVAIASAGEARPGTPLPRTLQRLGFRALMDRYWLRPDNLAVTRRQLFDQVVELSDCQQLVMAAVEELVTGDGMWSASALWPVAQIEAAYRAHIDRIKRSNKELRDAPLERVLKETFLYGGEVIRVLAQDPLLPSEMIDTAMRAELTAVMREYDQMFRHCWREHFGVEHLNRPGLVAD